MRRRTAHQRALRDTLVFHEKCFKRRVQVTSQQDYDCNNNLLQELPAHNTFHDRKVYTSKIWRKLQQLL